MSYLQESTADTIKLGPFLDSVDGVTPEAGLAGTMLVYLSKDGGALGLRVSTDAITYDRDGYYDVPLSAADVGAVGTLKAEVSDAAVHLPVWENFQVISSSEYAQVQVLNLYATASEVRAFKVRGTVVDLAAYTNAEIEDALNLASRMVDSICGDIFYTKSTMHSFDGNGLSELFFPPDVPYPAITATSVKNVDIDGTVLDTYVEGTDFVLYPYHIQVALAYCDDTPRRRVARGGFWPRGQQNIQVAGTWGRLTVPVEIKHATLLLTLERLKPGSSGASLGGVKQIVWNDFTVTFSGDYLTGQQTGLRDVDMLLARHINYSSLFMAVPDKRSLYGEHP
jgi:hypothetical protein